MSDQAKAIPDSKVRLWLKDELTSWRKEGLLPEGAADNLRERYQLSAVEACSSRQLRRLIAAVSFIGAVMLGMGVILFFAANWDKVTPTQKLLLIFAGIVAAYLPGYEFQLGRWKMPILGEALILLGAIFYGAGIWLVAQIFHINAHYPDGALLWGLGILPLAVVLRSLVVTVLASLLFLFYYGLACYEVASPNYLYLGLALGVLIPAYKFGSRLLILVNYVGIAGWFVISYCVLASWQASVGPQLCLVVLAGIVAYLLGRMHSASDRDGSFSPTYLLIGFLGVTAPMYLMTFADLVRALRPSPMPGKAAVLFWSGVAAALIVSTVAVVMLAKHETKEGSKSLSRSVLCEAVLAVLVGAVAILFLAFTQLPARMLSFDPSAIAILFNILLGVALMGMIAIGCLRQANLLVGLGLFGVVVLLGSRYFDMFWELMSRSQFFMIGGVLLLIVSWAMERARLRLAVDSKEVSHG